MFLESRASHVKSRILGPTPYSILCILSTVFKILLSYSARTYHVENTSRLDRLEPGDRDAVVSVAIAEAAALDDEVVDGVVQGGRGLRGWAGRQAGAALPPQQPHPQVGDLQQGLRLRAVRVLRGVRRGQRSEDHLGRETQQVKQKGGCQPAPGWDMGWNGNDSILWEHAPGSRDALPPLRGVGAANSPPNQCA